LSKELKRIKKAEENWIIEKEAIKHQLDQIQTNYQTYADFYGSFYDVKIELEQTKQMRIEDEK